MEELDLNERGRAPAHTGEPRDLLAILFRRRRLMALSFLAVLSGGILAAFLAPDRYEAAMKILVRQDRVDPIVTPEANAVPQYNRAVSEEELNSEVELLKSRDSLQTIVLVCHLQPRKNPSPFDFFTSILPKSRPGEQTAHTIRNLERHLSVQVVKKTNLISVNYESPDPELAARVLANLGNLYLEKHVKVHRPPGAADFFEKETERYRRELAQAEARLADFTRNTEVVSAVFEKELVLQKLADFNATLKQTEAAVAETQERVRVLHEETASVPPRMLTQARNSDDGVLLSQLRASLLTLEQRRTELLDKFAPTYRPVRELEVQIAQTNDAIASAEKSKLHEETTDRDPTYEWARQELARATADLASLQARAQMTSSAVRSYQERAQSLEQREIVQQGLIRTMKGVEDNYSLYRRKAEEARISDALDRGKILNVAIAEAPSVPSLPSNRRAMTLLAGALLGILVSLGLAFASEYLDSTFRTPYEVGSILNLPVLAAMPQHGSHSSNTYVC
jgi:uncharacterized protein involved in exopolysaccharide biosynthesis